MKLGKQAFTEWIKQNWQSLSPKSTVLKTVKPEDDPLIKRVNGMESIYQGTYQKRALINPYDPSSSGLYGYIDTDASGLSSPGLMGKPTTFKMPVYDRERIEKIFGELFKRDEQRWPKTRVTQSFESELMWGPIYKIEDGKIVLKKHTGYLRTVRLMLNRMG